MSSSAVLREMSRHDQRRALFPVGDPLDLAYGSAQETFRIPYGEVQKIQLAGLRQRFESLVSNIGTLKQLADRQAIRRIDSIEDGARLLFQHTVYKSYSLSLIDGNRFDKLTHWLNRLTTYDLSGIDVSSCSTIDEWLDTLEANVPLAIVHSTGTTGKLSFFPRSNVEMPHYLKNYCKYFEGFGRDAGVDIMNLGEPMPIFMPTYRRGRYIGLRIMEILAPIITGGKEEFCTAYPGFLSADLQSLGGRLAAAEANGETRLQFSESLMAKRDELITFREKQPEYLRNYFDRIKMYRGRRVYLTGGLVLQFDAMLEGEKAGLRQLFAPNSVILAGGGHKGRNLPSDYAERLCRYYGVPKIKDGFGMSELIGYMPRCEEEHYHVWPHTIVYVLDPDTGSQLPRHGVQTGRFAFMDLLAETYWGGLITGDEVTIHWDGGCECGRQGPFLNREIERYSLKRGGDDKISCAGTQDAHDRAVEYLLNL